MKPDLFGSWLRLDIVRDDAELRVEAKAGPDLVVEAEPGTETTHEMFGRAVRIASGTVETVARAADEAAALPGSGVLPVFVAPRRGVRHLPWEDGLADVLRGQVPAQNVELIRLVRPHGFDAPAPSLPLRVLAAGAVAAEAVAPIQTAPWFAHPAVAEHGLRIATTAPHRLERELRERDPSIVIADAAMVPAILRWGRGHARSPRRRLRLIIAIASGAVAQHARAPDGTSIIMVDRARAAESIRDVLYGLVHDRPLHAIVNGLRRSGQHVQLHGNPASMNSVRIQPVARQVLDEQALARERLARVNRADPATIDRLVGNDIELRFLNEVGGFTHTAISRANLAALPRARIVRALESIDVRVNPAARRDPALRARSVDLQLEHLDGDTRFIDRFTMLAVRRRYRLCMTIGLPLEGSLFDAAPPSLDEALPPARPDEERVLDVAVYGFGFAVLGSAVQRVRLPPTGPARPARFELRALGEGAARARVLVYYNNQVVQAFEVHAQVAPREVRSAEPVLSATTTFSRSPGLVNLANLAPRVATIAVNATPGPAPTHTFMLKGKAEPTSVALPEGTLTQAIDAMRAALYAATFTDAGNPRFSMASNQLDGDFAVHFRALARQGRTLYSMLAKRATVHAKLTEIRDSSNQTIQIVRLDLGFAFPWSIVYDFPLPKDDAPICVDEACTHGVANPGFCMRGFWGVRHAVEEVLGQGERDDTAGIVVADPGRRLAISLGTPDDWGEELEQAMASVAGAPAASVASDAAVVIDTLWDDKRRPNHMIVYSHYDEAAGGLTFETGVLAPGDLFDRWDKEGKTWIEPRTVVFMMACSTIVGGNLLDGFAENLHCSGALGIVGTEAPAFAALVTDFASKVGEAWWGGTVTLGEAVRRYRVALMKRGNPLGFVFTALGSSDLKLSKGGT